MSRGIILWVREHQSNHWMTDDIMTYHLALFGRYFTKPKLDEHSCCQLWPWGWSPYATSQMISQHHYLWWIHHFHKNLWLFCSNFCQSPIWKIGHGDPPRAHGPNAPPNVPPLPLCIQQYLHHMLNWAMFKTPVGWWLVRGWKTTHDIGEKGVIQVAGESLWTNHLTSGARKGFWTLLNCTYTYIYTHIYTPIYIYIYIYNYGGFHTWGYPP